MGLISTHMLSGESIETWLSGHRAERRIRIPRRRQGHEYNMICSVLRTCGPNQFHGYRRGLRDGMFGRIVHLLLSLLELATEIWRRRHSAVEERRAEVGIREHYYVRYCMTDERPWARTRQRSSWERLAREQKVRPHAGCICITCWQRVDGSCRSCHLSVNQNENRIMFGRRPLTDHAYIELWLDLTPETIPRCLDRGYCHKLAIGDTCLTKTPPPNIPSS